MAPELCDDCWIGWHDACDRTIWSHLITFPATCECDHPTHKDTP